MNKLGGMILGVGLFVSSFASVAHADVTYSVGKGDTLYKIATQHKLTVVELKKMNHLTTDSIYINQKLIVTQTAVKETTPPKPTTANSYTVSKGDTLYKIANKFGLKVSDLMEMNGLKSNQIQIGQVLKYTVDNENVKTPLPQKKLSTADQQIAAQLLKEKAITQAPSNLAAYGKVAQEAKKIMGTKYVFGGNTPKGIDCSGLIFYAYNKAGYDIPRLDTLSYFMKSSTKVEQPVPGDLVFFKNTYRATISHMGIYLGNNQFIHAGSSKGVEITNLNSSYWKDRFVSFKRLNVVS